MSDNKMDAVTVLLPCPFCGGTPWYHEVDWATPSTWCIQCKCGVSTRDHRTKETAASIWNKRHLTPIAPPQGELLGNIHKFIREKHPGQ